MHNPAGHTGQIVDDKNNIERNVAGADSAAMLLGNMLTKENLSIWTWLVSKGISNALTGLSKMIGKTIEVSAIDIKWLPATKVVNLLGGPENTVVGICLSIEGDATGHLLFLHDTKIAFQFIDAQLGLPKGSTKEIDEMEYSVLGEMGNIAGSFFLNAVADSTSLVLMPSPPFVLMDMVGAILNIPLTFIQEENDNAFVVKANFKAENDDYYGTFMLLPTMNFMSTLLDHHKN